MPNSLSILIGPVPVHCSTSERAILRAAQAYRNAENARNRAVADAVRRLL